MHTWTAELVVDERLARRILAQFELDAASLTPLAQGWDYTIWIVGDEWVFRFPRRAVVVPGIELEIRALPQLAPLLPLAVPEPVFVGRPTDEFPWPFYGSRFLPGRELGELRLGDSRRTDVARSLAAFLRTLHAAEIPGLPADANRRADMTARVPKTREQLAAIDGLWERPASVDSVLDEAERLPPTPHDSVVHGDLHFRQLLAEEDARLTGVIDWVDLCHSDPALDFAMYWGYFPPEAREAFLDAYGPVDDDQLLRARLTALSLWSSLAAYGHHEGAPAVEREALDGLARIALSRP